jgi:hypothetical protein
MLFSFVMFVEMMDQNYPNRWVCRNIPGRQSRLADGRAFQADEMLRQSKNGFGQDEQRVCPDN